MSDLAEQLHKALQEVKNGLRYWQPQNSLERTECMRLQAIVQAALNKPCAMDHTAESQAPDPA